MGSRSTRRPSRTLKEPAPQRRPPSLGRLAIAAALLLATLAVYQPAWHGEPLWDDEGHITRVDLRTGEGLWRIWTSIGATQQYYPVTHSAFWVQHALWGDTTLGYHLVNITLHALSAFLLGTILVRLAVPGAWLAAAIFALHPVHVESVAWISELKNLLSGFFYLSAALVYLHYDEHRSRRAYAAAAGLFVLAALSKTVTVTLPAALLVVLWWKRGRLEWRNDVRPLVPFFVIGIAAGLVTVWFERALIGAKGEAFELTAIERVLLAGRAVWFYFGKVLWPANLAFIYPRWEVSQAVWWQYVLPVAALLLLAAAWAIRGRARGPLAALLFFCGTLFPALGFFNVYPFVFSYVADHFQYLASIGIITLAAGGVAVLARGRPRGALAAGAPIVLVLALLTWRQAHHYADAETLYRATIEANPAAWLAHNNLSVVLLEGDPPEARIREAAHHAERAIELRPDYVQAQYNLGTALERLGRTEEAIAHYRRVLEVNPDADRARHRLGVALGQAGRPDDALAELGAAGPPGRFTAERHLEIGRVLAEAGRTAEAIAHFTEALRLEPASPEARHNLVAGLLDEGLAREAGEAFDEAAERFRTAIDIDPTQMASRLALGNVLHRAGQLEAAATEYQQALALDPGNADAHNDLGIIFARLGRLADAERHFAEAVRLDPSDESARANLARTRALRQAREE